jgi:hypothetical protein
MRLNAPKKITWWISTILAVLGVIGKLVTVPVLTAYAFPLVLIGFILLWLGTFVKGL